MQKLFFFLMLFLASEALWGQTVIIDEAATWFETAYVKWQPIHEADSYHVYYSGTNISNQKIDAQLIRNYGSYYRADILGLKAGDYTLKIVPVFSGVEGATTTTSTLTVPAHDRTGFAFINHRNPGAYKPDGTPKGSAVILYITENTKNTVSLEVTGASSNPCVGLQAILDGFKKGKDTRPLIIRLIGQITDLSYMQNGDLVIENNNNASSYITLEGVGEDAVADGWGIRIKNSANVEIRNLGIMNVNSGEGDNIGLQQNNQYIWIHHNDFFYGDAGGDADQAKGDGALDCKKSTYVTFSYNHFWDTGKSNLLGLSEGTTTGLYITYHHNWYDHSDSRHPRVRYYSAHVYNNYYDGNAKYGVGSTLGSSVFVEGNYFRNCKYPMLTSMQGSDVWNESKQANDYSDRPTFSKEDGGFIKAYNNYMTGQKRFVAYGDQNDPHSTVDFDAYVATTQKEQISSSITSVYGKNTYNHFDTDPSIMYSYTPDNPEEAKTKVIEYAGRLAGGDFQWAFNNAKDDTAYSVNTDLKAELKAYKTALISIQGESGHGQGTPPDTTNPTDTTSNPHDSNQVIHGDIVHNFTLSGKNSSNFNITGNLSDSKGTVNYNELSLTQCLKIESSTQVSFSLDSEATLTLVFNGDFFGDIKINGARYTVTHGILETLLSAGSYDITKGNSANLYYMSLTFSHGHTTLSGSIQRPSNPFHFDALSNRLEVSENYELQKIDIIKANGVFLRQENSQEKVIMLNHLKSGFYWVILTTKQGIFTQAIIKR